MTKGKKYLIRAVMILGLSLMLSLPVFAQEESPEDGEIAVREMLQKEKTESPLTFRVRTYLASGVNANVYKATEKQGVDVSYHQGEINWQQVRASGMEFAMIRVGYRGYGGGVVYGDTQFDRNVTNALAAGMKVGIYFFSQAMNEQEAYEEAIYTISQIQKFNITYPVVFDWETAPGYRTYDAGLNSTQMNALAKKFCDTVAAYGYTPMVYSNTVDFQGRYNYADLASRYYIWYARYLPEYGGTTWYASGNRLPNYDNNINFNMWQYMSDGIVPGISGYCDVNVTYLDFGTIKEPEVVNVQVHSSSSAIQINHNEAYITGIKPGMTCGELRNLFPDFYIGLNYRSSTADAGTVLKTGDVLNFATRSVYQKLGKSTYSIYIKGDVNGDGAISVSDMEEIQKELLGLTKLSGMKKKAAMLSGKDTISVNDMEKIQKKLLGLEDF